MKKLVCLFTLLPFAVFAQPYAGGNGPYSIAPGSVETVLNVKSFGAVGDGVADDTVAIQTALNTAVVPGATVKTVYLPSGRYKTTAALYILPCNGLEMCGEASSDFTGTSTAIAPTIIWNAATTDCDGIQMTNRGSPATWHRVYLHDFVIAGNTNLIASGVTNCGIRMDDFNFSNGGPFRHCRIERVNSTGWATAFKLYSSTGCIFQDCTAQYCLTNGWWLQQADTTQINNCWGLVGYFFGIGQSANDRFTCIRNDSSPAGGSAGITIMVNGGEWGNCYRFAYLAGAQIGFYNCNHESFFAPEVYLITTNYAGVAANSTIVDMNSTFIPSFGPNNIPIWHYQDVGSENLRLTTIINPNHRGYLAPWILIDSPNALYDNDGLDNYVPLWLGGFVLPTDKVIQVNNGGKSFYGLGVASSHEVNKFTSPQWFSNSVCSFYGNGVSLLSSNVATGTWNWTNVAGGAGPILRQATVYVAGGTVSGIGQNGSQIGAAAGTYTFVLQPNEWLGITNTVAPTFKFKYF